MTWVAQMKTSDTTNLPRRVAPQIVVHGVKVATEQGKCTLRVHVDDDDHERGHPQQRGAVLGHSLE